MKQLIEILRRLWLISRTRSRSAKYSGSKLPFWELKVAPSDLGKVIGKQGRTARSIRTILGAAGMKLNRRFTLEILE